MIFIVQSICGYEDPCQVKSTKDIEKSYQPRNRIPFLCLRSISFDMGPYNQISTYKEVHYCIVESELV